jgi:hypothetical protein
MLSRPPKGTPKPAPAPSSFKVSGFEALEPPRRGRRNLSAERRPWVTEMEMLIRPVRPNQRPLAPGPASEAVARRVWPAIPKRERPWASPESLARMLRRDHKRLGNGIALLLRREDERIRDEREFQLCLARKAEMERMLIREGEIQLCMARGVEMAWMLSPEPEIRQSLAREAETMRMLSRGREVQLLVAREAEMERILSREREIQDSPAREGMAMRLLRLQRSLQFMPWQAERTQALSRERELQQRMSRIMDQTAELEGG